MDEPILSSSDLDQIEKEKESTEKDQFSVRTPVYKESGETILPSSPPSSPPTGVPPTNVPPVPPITVAPEMPSEPVKKSRAWLYILLIIFFILIVPAGLVFATEESYLNLGLDKYYNAVGLERLWGGLPVNAGLALSKANIAMEQLKSYHFDGSLDVSGNVSLDNIPQISMNTNGGKVLGDSASSVAATIKMVGDLEKGATTIDDKLSTTLSVSLNSQGLSSLLAPSFSVDMRQVSNKLYFKIPALSILSGAEANKWVSMDLGQYATKTNSSLINIQKKLIDSIKSGTRLGQEDIKDKKTYHYQVVLNRSKLSDQSISLTTDPKVDFWIGTKDHLIYRIKGSTDIQVPDYQSQLNLAMDVNLSDFNKVFNITAPSEEEIAKEGLVGLLGGLGFGKSQAKERDVTRKADLIALKGSLDVYYEENGHYPVSPNVDKTNDPNGVLSKTLVPNYVKKLPVDPENPTKWYGYKSDGNTLTLWSLLEDTTDPEGKQDGQYFKYIITGHH